ncbi:MAG: DNA adenine methylase [Thermodesulfovibrionales bacterium]|nr:DNA adenine methylase [Thermodesulfovibrionales bacterium]
MKRLRSPIRYFGGKGNMVAKLLKHIPEHHTYCEVFGGGASLLFAKEPSKVEIYNDIDGDLVNLFRVLRDKEKFEEFHRKVSLTPLSREEYYYCRATYKDCDDVERAYRFFILARQSFSGNVGSGWGYNRTESSRNMAEHTSKYLSTIEYLPQIHERIMRVQIEHDDFRKVIPRYDTENTFFYLDPPYVLNTRRSGGYKHEITNQDHEDLINLLLNIKGKVMLSGYQNDIYRRLDESGWARVDYETACHAAGRTRGTKILGAGSAKRTQPRVESLWFNYNGGLFNEMHSY